MAGVVCLLLAVGFAIFLLNRPAEADAENNSANIVILSYDHEQRTIPTASRTVGELLNKLGIKIHQGDVVEPSLATKINQDKFRINIYRAVPVEISDGTHKIYTFSADASPREVAQQAGVKVYPEDWVRCGPVTNFARDDAIGEKVTIDRATPVKLRLYGHLSVIRTHAKTVGDLVSNENIKLHHGDQLRPSADTPLVSGLEIDVDHRGVKYETVNEKVPAPVKYIADANLSIGTSAIRQQGSDGQREVTYKIKTKNGHEISREAVQKVIVEKPVEEIIARGTAVSGPEDITSSIIHWANHYDVDSRYLLRVAQCESNFHPNSVNSIGATGLFQYMPSTWRSYSALAGQSGASIWDPDAQAHVTAWAFAHGKASAWSCA